MLTGRYSGAKYNQAADFLLQRNKSRYESNATSTDLSRPSTWRELSLVRTKGILRWPMSKTLTHIVMTIHSISLLSGRVPNKLLNTNDFKELLYYGVANAA